MDRFNGRIEFVDSEKVYDFLEKNNALPREKLYINQSCHGLKTFFRKLIKKKHANKFLAFGTTFIFMSWLVPIKIYYVIFGCIFLMFSLLCRLYGQDVEKQK